MNKGQRCALFEQTEYEFFWTPVAPKLVSLIAGQAPRCEPDLNTTFEWSGNLLTYEPAFALIILQTAQIMLPDHNFALVGMTHATISQVQSEGGK